MVVQLSELHTATDLVIAEFKHGVNCVELPWPDLFQRRLDLRSSYYVFIEGIAEVFPQELLIFHVLRTFKLFHS